MNRTHEILTLPHIFLLFFLSIISSHINLTYLGYYVIAFMTIEAIGYLIWMEKNALNIAVIIHHLITIILTLWPLTHPEHLHFITYNLYIELNTTILKLKHLVPKNTLLHSLLDYLFRYTWILLRLLFFPFLMWINHIEMLPYEIYQYFWVLGCQTFLLLFYVIWTFDIFL
jgi:hypothetical protein